MQSDVFPMRNIGTLIVTELQAIESGTFWRI